MPNPMSLELATSVQDRVPIVNAEIVSLEELEEMSLAEIDRQKKELSRRRKQINLRLDKRKIEQSEKIMDRMDTILDAMAKKLATDDVPASEVLALSNAYRSMLDSLNKVARLDSVDASGVVSMRYLEVQYRKE